MFVGHSCLLEFSQVFHALGQSSHLFLVVGELALFFFDDRYRCFREEALVGQFLVEAGDFLLEFFLFLLDAGRFFFDVDEVFELDRKSVV